MKHAYCLLTILSLVGLALFGCKSTHEQGVTSSYHTQWTTVAADTKTTTGAAEEVLMADELKDVKASATALDGKVTAKKADGTKVNVLVQKKGESTSEVSVTVGTLGDPALGAAYARRIKEKAEGK